MEVLDYTDKFQFSNLNCVKQYNTDDKLSSSDWIRNKIKGTKLVKTIQNYCKGGKVVFAKNFSFKRKENKKIANISKIKNFTKWRPRINLYEGLKKTINHYKI